MAPVGLDMTWKARGAVTGADRWGLSPNPPSMSPLPRLRGPRRAHPTVVKPAALPEGSHHPRRVTPSSPSWCSLITWPACVCRGTSCESGARMSAQTQVPVVDGKLHPHRLPVGAVRRPALVARLRSAREATLTLVCAPAGYGKSTLLTQWVHSCASTEPGTAFAWVSLDSADADPARFWTAVVEACTGAAAGVGTRALEAVRTLPDRQAGAALPLLIEDLAGLKRPLVLILDDFHEAETPEIDEAMTQFLTYRPSLVQVVVATRFAPSLQVPRLRALGQLVELSADDLAFSDPEAHRFLLRSGVRSLSPEAEEHLLKRAAGWPGALRIAARIMTTDPADGQLESFAGGHPQLVDYVATDVLGALPEDLWDFLLKVSVLDTMSGPLCDALTGRGDSAMVLADLERSSFFLSADPGAQWYRSHPLFQEALRAVLARTEPAAVPVLHARAARWFRKSGDLRTATKHAIAARDVPLIGLLLAGQAPSMAATGHRKTFRRWIARLDWPEADEDPEISYARAMDATLDGDLEHVEQWLDHAATGPAMQQDGNGIPLSCRVDLLRAITAVHDVTGAEAAGRRAARSAPTLALEGEAWCAVGQALYLQDRFHAARQCLTRALSLIPDESPSMWALACATLLLVETAQGSGVPPAWMLSAADEVFRSAGAGHTTASAVLEMARAEVHRAEGDLARASLDLESSLELLGRDRRSCLHANALLLLCRVQLEKGDAAAARSSLDAADGILSRSRAPGALPD